MLFYDENDDVCIKVNDQSYIKLYSSDIFELDGKFYTYRDNYFYEINYHDDGDIEIQYENKIHIRFMNIKEKMRYLMYENFIFIK